MKYGYKLFLIIFFLLFLVNTYAQNEQWINIEILEPKDGLIQLDNRSIFKDSHDLTWISSTSGLFLFDGENVKHFYEGTGAAELTGNIIVGKISEDKASNVWFSTRNALHRYNRKSGTFDKFYFKNKDNNSYISIGIDEDNQLWFTNLDSLYKFNISNSIITKVSSVNPYAQKVEPYFNENNNLKSFVTFCLQEGCTGIDMYEINDNTLKSHVKLFSKDSSTRISVRDVKYVNENELFIGAPEGLYKFKKDEKSTSLFFPNKKRNNYHFNAIENLNDSTVIIGSFSGWGYLFNTKTNTFTNPFRFSNNGIAIESQMQSIVKDKDGGVWINFPSKGLGFYNPDEVFIKFYKTNIKTYELVNQIFPKSIFEIDSEQVWINSSEHGSLIVDKNLNIKSRYSNQNSKLPFNTTSTALMDSKKAIWVITKSYLNKINIKDQYKLDSYHINMPVYGLCEVENQGIVIGVGYPGGCYMIREAISSFTIEQIENISVEKAFTNLYTLKNGLVLAAYNLSDIDFYDPENDFEIVQTIPFQKLINVLYQLNDSLLWIGTSNGIYELNIKKNKFTENKLLSEFQSLSINGIAEHDINSFAISSNYGVYFLNRDSQKINSITSGFGMVESNFTPGAICQMGNGEIWLGSPNGISIIAPNFQIDSFNNNRINITQFLVNDNRTINVSNYLRTGKGSADAEKICLNYQDNTISVSFASLNYNGNENNCYKYRLLPREDQWLAYKDKTNVRYANLPPGNYTFEVINDQDFHQSSNKADQIYKLDIVIIPPFYLQNWFILLSTILLAGMVFFVYWLDQKRREKILKLKFEKQLGIEQERVRIASDLHDDLGSRLSALALRANFIAGQTKNKESRNLLNQLAERINTLTQQVRETIWTINSKNDTLDNLITHIHQYSEEYFKGSRINCRVSLPSILKENPIDGSHRKNIFLIVKETLHNILKHAEAKNVHISIQYIRGNQLHIIIEDDGKGFETEKSFTGTGIQSMKQRSKIMGSNLSIQSNSVGTIISLTYSI